MSDSIHSHGGAAVLDASAGAALDGGGHGYGGKGHGIQGFQTANWVIRGDNNILNPALLSPDGSDLTIVDTGMATPLNNKMFGSAKDVIVTSNPDGSVHQQFADGRKVTDVGTKAGQVHKEEFPDGRKVSDIKTSSGSIHKEENPDGSSTITYTDDVHHRSKTIATDKYGGTTTTENNPDTYSQVRKDRNGNLIEGVIIDKKTNKGTMFRPGPDGNIIETPVSRA